jgi:hypothetical protein
MLEIEARAVIGEDRVLRVQMPADTPMGEVEVAISIRTSTNEIFQEGRQAAAWEGFGSLRHVGGSVEEFLAERRADDARRDRDLGL